MAQPLLPGDIYEATVVSYLNGQVGEFRVGFQVTAVGAPTATDADLAVYVDGQLAPLIKPLLATVASYRGVSVRKVSPVGIYLPQISNGNAGAGTGSGSPLPTQVRALLSWGTARAGRSYRGRSYIPFIASGFNGSQGHPTGAFAILMLLVGASYAAGYTVSVGGRTATVIPVIYSKKLNEATQIVSYLSPLLWATQRRSGDRGRLNPQPF